MVWELNIFWFIYENGKVTSGQEGLQPSQYATITFQVFIKTQIVWYLGTRDSPSATALCALHTNWLSLPLKLFFLKTVHWTVFLTEKPSQVTESTAASGRWRETEEGKVTSGQEGLQPVAVRDDNFSGFYQNSNCLVSWDAGFAVCYGTLCLAY